MNDCILAFDLGTSAVKATLLSQELKILAEASVAYTTHIPKEGEAEQNAQEWWEAACKSTRALFATNSQYATRVAAIGVSGHMLGLLAVDRKGEPLLPSMIHADTRAIVQAERLERELGADKLYRLTGNVLSPAATLCKALWFLENRPEIYAQTAYFLQSKDYLNFRLTGNMDATDFSDASHAMLINIERRTYLNDVFQSLGLDVNRFPSLHTSTEIVGYLQKSAASQLGLCAGIPVVAGGGDGACANVGAGISKSGDVYCSLGTTGWIACNMERPYMDEQRRVFNILSLDGKTSGVFGTVQCVGRAIAWAQALFELDSADALNALAAAAPEGCDGLVFLPYLEGERSPIFDAKARGVFYGIHTGHDNRFFARAVFEGVSYALANVLNIMRERGQIQEMRAIGGGTKSALWLQILSEAADVRIRKVDASAAGATSLGAAVAAGVGIGMFKSIEVAASNIGTTTAVRPNPENTAVYAAGLRKYQSLYPLLRPAFHGV